MQDIITKYPFSDKEAYIKKPLYKLYTKIYRKKTDRQNFLHINSKHPISLKKQHTL